jgi:hypothetical protein
MAWRTGVWAWALLVITGCQPILPCNTFVPWKDCRPFGALQGHDEPAPQASQATPKPLIICRDQHRSYYGINADVCPEGDVRIG